MADDKKENDKDGIDILLDKIESLEKRIKEKEAKSEKNKDKSGIDKLADETVKKDKEKIDEIKERMKKRGLL